MAYCSPATAVALVGQEVSAELLAVAASIIHRYTRYRWASTALIETFSGTGGGSSLFLRFPVISVTTFTIDFGDGTDAEQTEGTDFDVRKAIGELVSYKGLPIGTNNLIVTYNYGWQSTDSFYDDTYASVQMAEAMIALYLKKNPLLMSKLGVPGATLEFGDKVGGITPFHQYLAMVPKPDEFGSVGTL